MKDHSFYRKKYEEAIEKGDHKRAWEYLSKDIDSMIAKLKKKIVSKEIRDNVKKCIHYTKIAQRLIRKLDKWKQDSLEIYQQMLPDFKIINSIFEEVEKMSPDKRKELIEFLKKEKRNSRKE